LQLGFIDQPIWWLFDKDYLMMCMIIVSLWSSMGVGFLSLLAGLNNVDVSLYEAGWLDGVRTKLQQIWYLTIPMIKPQMLFGAVMALVNTLQAGKIGVDLTGRNPTPDYAGQMIATHMEEFAYIRYELGYATAVSVVLLIIMYTLNRFCFKILGNKGDE
jgi:multiple sugar transport system permease protein